MLQSHWAGLCHVMLCFAVLWLWYTALDYARLVLYTAISRHRCISTPLRMYIATLLRCNAISCCASPRATSCDIVTTVSSRASVLRLISPRVRIAPDSVRPPFWPLPPSLCLPLCLPLDLPLDLPLSLPLCLPLSLPLSFPPCLSLSL